MLRSMTCLRTTHLRMPGPGIVNRMQRRCAPTLWMRKPRNAPPPGAEGLALIRITDRTRRSASDPSTPVCCGRSCQKASASGVLSYSTGCAKRLELGVGGGDSRFEIRCFWSGLERWRMLLQLP
ncbi:hypothetical protein BV25DRAFT_1503672 [Artomyces pyxidatus]|uniref:Uncharacterized protein n=1 Tax=Artomyces pyxidatus TaxID=48021 RepID=A0ACB8TD08_9AGAM|nr:hypothetical protein BV25DRAFT_1503672 [Artomyces pyxidatus]